MYVLRRDGDAERGPLRIEDLLALARAGQLRSTDLVREEHSPTWRMAGELPELRAAFAPPAPGPFTPPPSWTPGAVAIEPLRRADPVGTIVLSVITLSIYGLIWFYRTLKSYQSVAGLPASNARSLFGWYVTCKIVAILLAWPIPIGALLAPVVVVLGALLLAAVIRDRDVAAARIGGIPGLHPITLHLILWLIGEIATIGCLGVILLIIQAVLFIQDHNRLVEEFSRRQPSFVSPN